MSSMRFPSREEVEKVRNEYPKGCRVVLERMDDMQAPPIGTEGTVNGRYESITGRGRWQSVPCERCDDEAEGCRSICQRENGKHVRGNRTAATTRQ